MAEPGYEAKTIALGTNTDPYQPIEGRYGITREILEVCLETRHPVTITTKSDRDFMKHFFGPSPKTFPSRINDANVAPTVAAAPTPAMQSVPVAMPTMPGGFQPPALPGAASGAR